MEQPRTNAATCVIPMEPAVPGTPGSEPNPESTEFATKILLKFDPLVAADNSQRAAFKRKSVFKKISVFIFLFTGGLMGVICFLVWFIYKTSAENAIQQQNHPNDVNNGNNI